MFKYFNEEETNEIFESNKEFKNILDALLDISKMDKYEDDYWIAANSFIKYIPKNIFNILKCINYNCYYGWLFRYNIVNVKNCIRNDSVNLFYYKPRYPGHCNEYKYYDFKRNYCDFVILKGKDYFYILTNSGNNDINLFYMLITNENKDDNIYYKIEMDMTL